MIRRFEEFYICKDFSKYHERGNSKLPKRKIISRSREDFFNNIFKKETKMRKATITKEQFEGIWSDAGYRQDEYPVTGQDAYSEWIEELFPVQKIELTADQIRTAINNCVAVLPKHFRLDLLKDLGFTDDQ